jgi:hypothetical protein
LGAAGIWAAALEEERYRHLTLTLEHEPCDPCTEHCVSQRRFELLVQTGAPARTTKDRYWDGCSAEDTNNGTPPTK